MSRTPKANLENTLQNRRDTVEDALTATKGIRTTFLDSRVDKLETRMAETEAGGVRRYKKLAERIEAVRTEVGEDVRRSEAAACEQLTRLLRRRGEQLTGFERDLAGRRQQEENVVRILDQEITSARTEGQRETLDRTRGVSDLRKWFEGETAALGRRPGLRQSARPPPSTRWATGSGANWTSPSRDSRENSGTALIWPGQSLT